MISVVIIAHERKEFILDAIKSMKEQSAQIETYEVIVIKKFVDKKIDDVITENKYINILTKMEALSDKIKESLQFCKGSFVSFLEDDDLFVKDKIKEMIKLINEYPDATYIHNDNVTIDINGNIREFKLGIPFQGKVILKINSSSFLDYAKIAKIDPDFNLSSITIRMDVLKSYIQNIINVNYGVDPYLYLSSIDYGEGSIIITPQVLTLYRYYRKAGLTITPIEGRNLENVGQYIHIQSYYNKLFLGVFKTEIPKKILTMKIIEENIKTSILTEKISPIKDLKLLIKFSIFGLKIKEYYKIELTIMSILNVFSHNLSKNIYIKSGLFFSKHYPNVD